MQRNDYRINDLFNELVHMLYDPADHPKAYTLIRNILLLDPNSNQAVNVLKKIAKEAYGNTLNEKKRILMYIQGNDQLLLQSLDPNTALGRIFWKQKGLTTCSLEKGTLKEICDILVSRNISLPNQDKNTEETIVSVTTHSVFINKIDPNTLKEENSLLYDEYSHKMFPL